GRRRHTRFSRDWRSDVCSSDLADTRAAMHANLAVDEAQQTDSVRMFRMGLDGGKPAAGKTGVQPEWFYKGDGSIVAPPGGDVASDRKSVVEGKRVERDGDPGRG